MKQLILVRHAKSSWKDSSLADIDRPLNGRGKRDAPRIGAWLASEGHYPDQIVSSPAKRARSTARKLAKALDYPKGDIAIEDALYAFDDGAGVIAALTALDDAHDRVLIVGHNPTFTTLAWRLGGLELENLPTCGAVGVDFAIDAWRDLAAVDGAWRFHMVPKALPED